MIKWILPECWYGIDRIDYTLESNKSKGDT